MNEYVGVTSLKYFSGVEGVALCEALGAYDFHNILCRSYFALTDSGGVQEEAASLGIPVLVTRNSTEREEGILSGGIRLIGVGRQSVYRGVSALLDSPALRYAMTRSNMPFGRGGASERIAEILENGAV